MLPLLLNRWVQLAAGTALALVFGFGVGHHQKTLEDASAALSGAKRAVQTEAKAATATAKINTASGQAIAKTADTTITNLQRVPLYVTRQADDRCVVGVGAVRVLDAAAHDQPIPAPAIGLQDADSGVALSELVTDDVANAGSYHQLAERLKAWEDWWDAQARIR